MKKLGTVVNGKGVELAVAVEKELGVELVVFYDTRFTEGFTEWGQRVNGFPVDLVAKQKGKMWLCQGVEEWTLTPENLEEVIRLVTAA